MPSSEPYLGSVDLAGYSYANVGFAVADGSLIPWSQNTALGSILHSTFGGSYGQSFGLPDLRSRMPMGMGQGNGLTNRVWGQTGGQESETLTILNLPPHAHEVSLGGTAGPGSNPAASGTAGTTNATTAPTGSGVPFSTLPPFLALPYLVAIMGVYPSQN